MTQPIPYEITNTAMTDQGHLIRWLQQSDRRFLVIDAVQAVKSLPWPDGVAALMQVIDCYKQHRQTIPSGMQTVEEIPNPISGKKEKTPIKIMLDDRLTPDEIDDAIKQLERHKISMLEEWVKRDAKPEAK